MADKNRQDTESEPSEYETDSGDEGETLTSPYHVEKKPSPSSTPKSSSTPKTLEKPQNVPEPDDGDDDSSSEEEADPKSEQVLRKPSIFSTRKALEKAPNSSSDDEYDDNDDDDNADASSEQGLGSKSEQVNKMPSHSSSPKALEKIQTLLPPKPLKHVMGFILKKTPLKQQQPSSSSDGEDDDAASEEVSWQFLKRASPSSNPKALEKRQTLSSLKPPKQLPSSSSDDDDDDDDASSEGVSEPKPGQSINAKEIEPSSRKRPSEEEKVFDAKVSKKQKKHEVEKSEKKPAAAAGTKTILFQKLWTDEDVLALLQGLIEFKKSSLDYNVGVFHDSIKDDLHIQYSRTQFGDKISKLKQKYLKNAKWEREAKNGAFSNPFDRKVYDLSKKLWGSGNGVEKAGAVAKVSEGGKANGVEKTGAVGEGYDSQREWKRLEIEEFEIYIKQLDVSRKQAELVLEALRSRYS